MSLLKLATARAVYRNVSVIAVSFFVMDFAYTAQWVTTKGFSADTTYTDNRDLSDDNEKGEISLGIRPRIGITGRGARLNLNLNYSPSYRIRSSEGNSLNHNLASSLNAELQEDWLFLDASANARQALIDPDGRNGGDDVNRNNNTTQTFNYTISPYTRHHFGGYADSSLRYTYRDVINSSSSTADSSSHTGSYSLSSGRHFPDTPWNFSSRYQYTNYEDGDNSKTINVSADVRKILNRIWSVDFYGFYDDYDIETSEDEVKGLGGGAGFTWTPSERTFLRAAYGYRYEQWNAYFDFSHRSRRSTWTASLTHDVQTSRDFQLAQTFDEEGNPEYDPDSPNLERNDEYYILDRFQTRYTLTGRKTTFSVNGYASQRDYQVSGDNERNYGVSTSLRRRLRTDTSANVSLRWNNRQEDSGESHDNNVRFSADLDHTLLKGARSRLALKLRHLRNIADVSDDEYTENRVTLSLNSSW